MRLAIMLLLLGQALPAQDIADAKTLNREVADLYRAGKYAEAVPLAERSLALTEKALGPDHPDTATCLNNLALLHEKKGEYTKAEPLYQRALAIQELALGPDQPGTADTLNNLALLYQSTGAYADAERLFQRSLNIREKILGADHPDTAISLNSLGLFYSLQGAYAKAEPLLQRALNIREKLLGPANQDNVPALNNLGLLYMREGAYTKAEPILLRALAIRQKALGRDHPDVAASLNNLAGVYESRGSYSKAEPLFQRALDISEKVLGPDHLSTAAAIDNLATVYYSQRAYTKAEPLLKRALDIRQRLEPDHPDTAKSLNNLAELYESQKAFEKAEPLYRRALVMQERALGPDHPDTLVLNGNLVLLYGNMGRWSEAAAKFSTLIDNPRDRSDMAFGRNSQQRLIVNARGTFLALLHAGASLPDQRGVYLPLLLKTILISKARLTEEERDVLQIIKKRGNADDQKLTQKLERTISQLVALDQKGPGSQSPAEYRKAREDLAIQESDLRAQLSTRSAEFRKLTEEPSPEKIAPTLGKRILIEILRTREFYPTPDKLLGSPLYVAVALFPDGHIDMADLGPAKPIEDQITAYREAEEVIDNPEQTTALAEKLGQTILAPIARMAGPYREWFVAPDGEIRLLPLNALRLHGKYVAETYRVWPLGSGRDLLAFDTPVKGGEDLIIANPDFGEGKAFVPLLETEDEAESIGNVLSDAKIVEPVNRSKSFLLNLTSAPRILHLSTHAFYHSGKGNAMLRSGIALNGANLGPEGILTAKEAEMLRLPGTQLVVMSACDTGAGDVSLVDGVVGLQRALTLAGARAQMLTQWSVNSAGTRDFMVKFYSKMAAGESKGDAWIDTQRDLIREGVPPHFWAPFVLYGDPGPLGEK